MHAPRGGFTSHVWRIVSSTPAFVASWRISHELFDNGLRFVEGEPLDWRPSDVLRVARNTLGTIHRILLEDGTLTLSDHLFGYVIDDTAWGRQPDRERLIDRARMRSSSRPAMALCMVRSVGMDSRCASTAGTDRSG